MVKLGEFVYDYKHATLRKQGSDRKVEPQINELLGLFVSRPDVLITKDEIIQHLWRGRVVSDDAFRAVIKKLRKTLDDNAKHPMYIKTIPLKGYVLIAETSALKNKNYRYMLALVALIFSVFSSVVFVELSLSEPHLEVTKLTHMSGSELTPSFNDKTQHLLFSHRSSKDDFLQIYTQSLATGEVKRLSFDEANFANVQLSPNGHMLAFTKSTPSNENTYIADFNIDNGLSDLEKLPANVADGRYFQAWSASSDGVYLSDLKGANGVQGLIFYDLINKTSKVVTSSTNKGRGDYFARESANGEFLAILRNLGTNDNELLIMHLRSGELSHIVKLKGMFKNLVWSESDNGVILSTFEGTFSRYSLETRQFEVLPIKLPYTNDVFAHCGKNCLYARQHNGDYLDIELKPNPFNKVDVVQFKHWEMLGAEDFPVFGKGKDSIYFTYSTHDSINIVHRIESHVDVLAKLPANTLIEALQVNASETYLSGIMNGRLFLINLLTKEIGYLTTQLESIASVYWENDSAVQYARFESGAPVLYRYKVDTAETIRIGEALLYKIEYDDGRLLFVDGQRKVWFTDKPESQAPRLVSQLPSANPNRWSTHEQWLYYPNRQENVTYMNRINLSTGEVEQQFFAKNRFKINFDLTDDGRVLAGVRSKLAQSDLVEIRW